MKGLSQKKIRGSRLKKDKIMCMLPHVKLSKAVWREILIITTYLINIYSYIPLDDDVPNKYGHVKMSLMVT